MIKKILCKFFGHRKFGIFKPTENTIYLHCARCNTVVIRINAPSVCEFQLSLSDESLTSEFNSHIKR